MKTDTIKSILTCIQNGNGMSDINTEKKFGGSIMHNAYDIMYEYSILLYPYTA